MYIYIIFFIYYLYIYIIYIYIILYIYIRIYIKYIDNFGVGAHQKVFGRVHGQTQTRNRLLELLDEHFNIIEFHGTFLQLHCIAFLFCCPTSAGNKDGANHMRKHSSCFSETLAIPFKCVCVLGSISKAMEANGCCSHQLYPVPNSLWHQVHSSTNRDHWDHRRVDPVANANQGQQRTPGMAKQRNQQLGSGVLDLSMCWVVGC